MLALSRRLFLSFAATVLVTLSAQAQQSASPPPPKDPPVVFVHGNGDTAALWIAQIWRFESNGYARDQLFAINLKHPSARTDDAKPQEGRSSTEDVMKELAAYVADVKRQTGADKVALVGNSRGANTIRNYVRNGGGKEHVSHVVLGGGVNHGILKSDTAMLGSEFNGNSDFIKRLNDGPSEVVDGVKFMTIRSDRYDKYAQPDGLFIGMAGQPTGISYDGPELKGAVNFVLDGLDHREVSYALSSFVETYRFITGRVPARLEILPQTEAVLNGNVTGITAGAYDNIGVADAKVEIFEVDPRTGARLGEAAHSKTTGADGAWGPFAARSDAYYEFVVAVPGQPITHIYRSPFPRGSNVVHLRPARLAKGDEEAGSVITITRPRGYFGHGRDVFTLDGKTPGGINEGVPGASTGKLVLPAGPPRAVPVRFNLESFAVQSWPASEKRLVLAEFTY